MVLDLYGQVLVNIMVSKTKGVLKLKYLFRLIYKSSGTDDLDALSA